MMKNYIIGILMSAVLVSCENELQQTSGLPKTTENKVKENILATTPSVYSNYFESGSYLAGYSSLKENSLADEELVPVFSKPASTLKSASNTILKANGQDILAAKSSLKNGSLKKGHDLYNSWYGQDVKFVLKEEGKLKSSSSNEQVIEMYIPELVEILSPPIQTQEELYPYCYYDNFILKWNADVNNQNGLVVIVEWLGTVLSEEGDEDTYVRNIDVIQEDDGNAILNNKLFENIPHLGLSYVTLLRGNIAVAELDSTKYRVFGESHAVLPMVLIKELSKE